jgi:TPR repeat protein
MTFVLQASTIKELEEACKAKDGASCRSLGILYQVGKDIAQSNNNAKTYYFKACQLKDSEGCILLGDIYYYSLGIDQDNSQAKQYYEKACKMKNKKGCNSFKKLQVEERVIEKQKAELERLMKEQEELLMETELLEKI